MKGEGRDYILYMVLNEEDINELSKGPGKGTVGDKSGKRDLSTGS